MNNFLGHTQRCFEKLACFSYDMICDVDEGDLKHDRH